MISAIPDASNPIQQEQTQSSPFFRGSVPLPPSINAAYKRVTIRREGKEIKTFGPTDALEQFKADAALMLSQAVVDWDVVAAIRESRYKVPLAVSLRCYFSSLWKRDVDGVIKFAVDAAFQRLKLNDNLVVSVAAEKHVDQADPRVEIVVRCVVR